MYITRGFCNICCNPDSQMVIFNILTLSILTYHGSIERCVVVKVMLAQSEVIYSQCHALVLIPISLLPYLLVLQRLLCQIAFLMRK